MSGPTVRGPQEWNQLELSGEQKTPNLPWKLSDDKLELLWKQKTSSLF